MNKKTKRELTELCMMLALRKRPLDTYEFIGKVIDYMGTKNLDLEQAFWDLRFFGYCNTRYEETDGKGKTKYFITEKGLEYLSDIFAEADFKPRFSEEEIKNLLNSKHKETP